MTAISLRVFPQRTALRLLSTHRMRGASPSIRFYDTNRRLKAYPPPSISYHNYNNNVSTDASLRSFSVAAGSSTEPQYHNHCRKCRLPSDFLPSLLRRHPSLSISFNPYDLDSHGHGESYHPISAPDAVIRPTSVREIQDILRLCCQQRTTMDGEDIPTIEIVSVIPYGAGIHNFCRLGPLSPSL